MFELENLSIFDFLGDKNDVWKEGFRCLAVVKENSGAKRCDLVFQNANQLREHKIQAGHQIKRKRKAGEAGRNPKQLRLEEVFNRRRQVQEPSGEESDGSDEGFVGCFICEWKLNHFFIKLDY